MELFYILFVTLWIAFTYLDK